MTNIFMRMNKESIKLIKKNGLTFKVVLLLIILGTIYISLMILLHFLYVMG